MSKTKSRSDKKNATSPPLRPLCVLCGSKNQRPQSAMLNDKSKMLNGLIAMLHVPALPGTPNASLSIPEITKHVLAEAKTYTDHGIRSLMIENMHDVPYLRRDAVGPEITASMTAVACALRQQHPDFTIGIQILAGANKQALAVAHAASLNFIRAEGFVFAHVADEGIIESDAAELLRYRKFIGAEHVQILTDIKKKHSSHALTADLDIAECAKAAEYFQSDGIIITGTHTGSEPDLAELESVASSTKLPIIIGSGLTPENAVNLMQHAQSAIVGSYFKKDGHWKNSICIDRIQSLIKAFH
jgi:membrane complex biogenesis BtpA family protein